MTAEYIKPSFQQTSILDATNAALRSIGSAPVATVDPSPDSDVDMFLDCLDEADRQVQSRGWHWNREYKWQLPLSTAGTIILPDQTLMVTQAYWASPSVADVLDVAQRGQMLYNHTTNSYVFTAALLADMIIRLSWDLVPQVARSYIVLLAIRSFHASLQGREIVLEVTEKDLDRALVTLEQNEDQNVWFNAVNGNVSVVTNLYGIGGMRRNRGGY